VTSNPISQKNFCCFFHFHYLIRQEEKIQNNTGFAISVTGCLKYVLKKWTVFVFVSWIYFITLYHPLYLYTGVFLCQNAVPEVLSQKDASWSSVPDPFIPVIDITPPPLWPNFESLCILEPIFFREVALLIQLMQLEYKWLWSILRHLSMFDWGKILGKTKPISGPRYMPRFS
jgi:hypothetical protein